MPETIEDRAIRVLVVGESWVKHIIHIKGFDEFRSVEYEEGAREFLSAIAAAGFDVTYIRAHEVSGSFPTTLADLQQYDVVLLSDIGSNSFLLTDETFLRSEPTVNRLALLGEYTAQGGGLAMIGGYMSFTGIDARARYGLSPLAEVLPVRMLEHDDRIELPEGATPRVVGAGHPSVDGLPLKWPALLGYNRVMAKDDAHTIVMIGEDDPLLVVGTHGEGRTVAFSSDLAPHWAPPEFVSWEHYQALWVKILSWAGRSSPQA